MTKTKLAKLKLSAQANAAIAPDLMEDLNEVVLSVERLCDGFPYGEIFP